MMRFDAGAKVVTVGGRPRAGPMQAAGGTRGARSYDLALLDDDMASAKQWAKETGRPITSLPERINDLYIVSAEINVRDHIRFGQDVPLQFKDDPADCRLYHTMETLFNQTFLWNLAANAIWDSDRPCVPSSTAKQPPSSTHPPHISTASPTRDQEVDAILKDDLWGLGGKGVQAVENRFKVDMRRVGKECTKSEQCQTGEDSHNRYICAQVDFNSSEKRCSVKCFSNSDCSSGNGSKLTGTCYKFPLQNSLPNRKDFCEIWSKSSMINKHVGR
jgi:hypothetical protein